MRVPEPALWLRPHMRGESRVVVQVLCCGPAPQLIVVAVCLHARGWAGRVSYTGVPGLLWRVCVVVPEPAL